MKKFFMIILSVVVSLSLCACGNSSEVEKASVSQENPYEVGKTVTFGKCEQDNNWDNGTESIEWIVLDEQDGRALLLSKRVLFCWGYDTDDYGTGFYNYWQGSNLKQALTEGNAFEFSDEEISKIVISNESRDILFVLSYEELQKYFPNAEDRKAFPTILAAEQFEEYALERYEEDIYGSLQIPKEYSPGESVEYYTRTPVESDGTNRAVITVFANGDFGSEFGRFAYLKNGVRPAVWIRTK